MDKYLDKDLPIEERVEDLLSKMTLEEKAAQLKTEIYHFWKEFATFLENLPVEGLKEEEVGSAFDMFFDFITKHSN
ncbi:MAG TPA: hypothetical protein ENF81_08865, partial [Thermotogaceae bacterium]|nr:hypothetical protein [Thermotogaceae bacterium]